MYFRPGLVSARRGFFHVVLCRNLSLFQDAVLRLWDSETRQHFRISEEYMAEKDFYLYIEGQPVKVSEEVYREYKHAEEKERYFMKRLKKGKFVVDPEKQTVEYVPSREASYEHLLEADWDFPAPDEPVDGAVIKAQTLETLDRALQSLTDEERELIHEIFYLEKSEREISAVYNLTQAAIHKRKKKILEKLKKFF